MLLPILMRCTSIFSQSITRLLVHFQAISFHTMGGWVWVGGWMKEGKEEGREGGSTKFTKFYANLNLFFIS